MACVVDGLKHNKRHIQKMKEKIKINPLTKYKYFGNTWISSYIELVQSLKTKVLQQNIKKI